MQKTGILQHAHYHSEQLQQASRDSILHFARPAGHVSVFCARCRLPGHFESLCTQTLPDMPRSTNKAAGRIYPELMSPQDTPTGLTRTEATLLLAQRWAGMTAKEQRDWARCKSAQEHHGLSKVSTFLAGDIEKFPPVPPRVAEKPVKRVHKPRVAKTAKATETETPETAETETAETETAETETAETETAETETVETPETAEGKDKTTSNDTGSG